MSLFVAADGLLQTHVTWQDVEFEMQTAFETTATFGPNKKATNISDMKGFLSKIALIHPDWQNVNGSENLPTTFVVKIASQLAYVEVAKMFALSEGKTARLEVLTREVHNREVEAYKFLTKMANPNIPITKVYAYRSFTEQNLLKGFIVSDFVPNTAHIGVHENIDARDSPPFIRALGSLSASVEKLPDQDFSFTSKSDYIEVLFKELFDADQWARIFTMLRAKCPQEYLEKVDHYEEFFKMYSNPGVVKKYPVVSEYLGAKNVLCHCDPWSTNFLMTKEDGRTILKAVIDWQTIAVCNPAIDICRHLVACLSPADRAAKRDEFLEMYYNTMLAELGENATPPYTLEQLHHSYHIHLPILALLVLPGIFPFLERAQIPEDQREAAENVAVEKMIGLLNDAVKSHEYNMKHFPDFFEV